MNSPLTISRTALAVAVMVGIATSAAPQTATPETVMVTYHAKSGSETALAGAIAKQWEAARRLNLVGEAHTLVRGSEDGKTYFVEIFTWRDANTPDAPPVAIQNVWSEMSALVESRGGKPGIEFTAVSLVGP
jgi:hypothetical protein